MTLSEMIKNIRLSRRDSRSVTDGVLTDWINKAEYYLDNLPGDGGEIFVYDYVRDADRQLTLPDGFTEIYTAYLCMMLDICHDNAEGYRRDKKMYDRYMLMYSRARRAKA